MSFFHRSFLTPDWNTDVVVVRSGGRDAKGNPLPEQRIPVTDCQVVPRSTADPVDRSDVADSSAILYRTPPFNFESTDRIEVPEGERMAGTWSIDGSPGEWPDVSEIGLVRG